MARRLVVLASHEELARRQAFEAFVRLQIEDLTKGDALLVGGAPPAEELAIHMASGAGITLVEFRSNGWRYENGIRTQDWSMPELFDVDRKHAISVYRAMYIAACKAHGAGWFVQTKMFTPRGTADIVPPHTDGHPVELTVNDLPSLPTPGTTVPAPLPASGLPHVWIDLETGGRSYTLSPIIEIGAVLTDSTHRPLLGTYESRVAVPPNMWVEDQARAVNGYNEAEWRDAREEPEVLFEFLQWLPREFVLCGYNVSFDRGFLRAGFNRYDMREPGWKSTPVDPLYVVRSKYKKTGRVSSGKLDDVCRHFGIVNHVSHRALVDAERARLVNLAMMGKKPDRSIFDPGWKP